MGVSACSIAELPELPELPEPRPTTGKTQGAAKGGRCVKFLYIYGL